jgi:hypothetical protein
MAFPTVTAEISSDETTNTTTHTVDMPSGSGGTLLTILGFDARPIVSGQIPDNWASNVNTAHSGDLCALRAYTLPGGAGGASQTITTDAGQCSGHHTMRLDGAAAFEAAVFQGTTGSSFDPPSLDPSWATEDVLWIPVSVNDDGTITITGFPTNYIGTGQVNAGDAADGVTLAWARRELNAASEDPGAFTASGTAAFCTALIAVRPVSPVAHVATGTKSAGSATATSIAYPGSIAAGQMILAFRSGWRSDITMADESGWTNTLELGGGTGTAIDAHTTKIRCDRREATGSESGSVTFDQSGSTNPGCLGIMVSYAKAPSTATWDVATATGDDAAHGANRSVTASSALSFQPGDVLVIGVATDTDANLASFGTLAVSASGITFSTPARRSPASAGVGTGDDGNVEVFEATVTAGSGTVAPTVSFNTTTNQCGPAGFVRLRALSGTDLEPDDAAQAQAAEEPSLTQTHVLAAADAGQGQSAESPALTQVHVLEPDDAAHAHTADQSSVTVVSTLVPDDAAHTQTVDEPALSQAHSLAAADSTHTASAESPGLTQAHSLVSADASHTQTADQPAVTQAHVLAPADAGQAQTAESPPLTQAHQLAAADALHTQAAEQPSLSEAGPSDLFPADALHAHRAEQPTLTQQHTLAPADAGHGHTAESPTVGQVHTLQPADAAHAHTAESPAVGQLHQLEPADALHAQEAGSPSLGSFGPDVPSQGTFDDGRGVLVYATGADPLTYATGGDLIYDP